jgi:hypothetical protein
MTASQKPPDQLDDPVDAISLRVVTERTRLARRCDALRLHRALKEVLDAERREGEAR